MACIGRFAASVALAAAVACLLQGCGDSEPKVESSEGGDSFDRRTPSTTTLAPQPILRCADSGSGCSGVKALHLCGAVGSTFCRKTCELCTEGSKDGDEPDNASTSSAPVLPNPGDGEGEDCHDVGTGCDSVESLGLCSTIGKLFCKSTCGHCTADLEGAATTTKSGDDGDEDEQPTTSPAGRASCEDRGTGCIGIKQFGLCSTVGRVFCKETCELCEGDGDAITPSTSTTTTFSSSNESTAATTTQIIPTGGSTISPAGSATTAPPAVVTHRTTSLRTTTGRPDTECEDVGSGCERTEEWGLCSTFGRLFCRETCGYCEEAGN